MAKTKPRTPSGRFMLRVPKTLHRDLKLEAVKEGVSLNHLVASLLAEEVGRVEGRREAKAVQETATYNRFYTVPPLCS